MSENPLSRLARAMFRSDSWFNNLTGFGTERDKTMGGAMARSLWLSDPEITALYEADGIAAKIVNVVPREVYRQGWNLVGDTDGQVGRVLRGLDAVAQFKEGAIWGRAYGGAVLFVGADDGQDPREPLDEARIQGVPFLQVYDRRYAQPFTWYENPEDPKFGTPKVWRLTAIRSGRISWVHESRIIVFRGAHTNPQTRHARVGWDLSVLQAPYDVIRQFWANHKATENLMTDASQGVFKIRGLMGMIAAGGMKDLQARAILMDQTRSIARSIMLDADGGESFDKVQTTFSGIPDVLDRSANLVAAVTEIPVTILMGQAPAGLNATGESDVRVFYDRIRSEQETDARPRVERLVGLVAMSLKVPPPQVVFPSLWQETPRESAERRKLDAETLKLGADMAAAYVQSEVATPEEIALSGSVPYSIDPATRRTPEGIPQEDVPGARPSPPDAGLGA